MTTQLKAPYDADIVRITRESEERRQREPHADSVSYDSSTRDLIVTLRGGSVVRTDARSLRGLGRRLMSSWPTSTSTMAEPCSLTLSMCNFR